MAGVDAGTDEHNERREGGVSIESDLRWHMATIWAYKPVKDPDAWLECPACKTKPRVWLFDNGRYAKCLCDEKYKAARVSAVAINAVWRETGSTELYDRDELRRNWNAHVQNIRGIRHASR